MSKSGTHLNTVQLPGEICRILYNWQNLSYTCKKKPTAEQLKNIKELLDWEWSDE